MPKSVIRRYSFFVFGLSVIVVLYVFICLNGQLQLNKNAISKAITNYFKKEIRIGNVHYSIPNLIQLEDVRIYETKNNQESLLVVFPLVSAKLSMTDLIVNRSVSVKKLDFHHLIIENPQSYFLLKDQIQHMYELIQKLPSKDIVFSLNNAKYNLTNDAKHKQYLGAEFKVSLKGNKVDGGGVFSMANRNPVGIDFSAFLDFEGIFFQEIELNTENSNLRLWGSFNDGEIKLKGHSFVSPISNSGARDQFASLLKVNHHIVDINTLIKIVDDSIKIDHISLNVQKIPIRIRGEIGFGQWPTYDLKVSAFPRYAKSQKIKEFNRVDLDLQGRWENFALMNSGAIKISTNLPIDRFELSFDQLVSDFSLYPEIPFNLSEIKVRVEKGNDAHSMQLQNLAASLNMRNEYYTILSFDAPFYEGKLSGRVGINSMHRPSKFLASVKVDEANTYQMDDIYKELANTKGRLFGRTIIRNYPEFDLKGVLQVKDGELNQFAYLQWFSEYFNLPSLTNLSFDSLSSKFYVNKNHAGLKDIEFHSIDLSIVGNFDVKNDEMVQSTFSLILDKELMSTSSYLKPIVKRVKNESSVIPFDFKLSGSLSAIKFQWMDSDIKEQIESRIPKFVQRKIERSIESSMKE